MGEKSPSNKAQLINTGSWTYYSYKELSRTLENLNLKFGSQ